MTPSTKKPHVLILGAGIGGLTLAQALRAKEIPFSIFERDPSDSARKQGWCIALHSIIPTLLSSFPADMPAIDVVDHLRPLGLPAQLCIYPNIEVGGVGKKFIVQSGPESRIIRANRALLREWLSTNVTVDWGCEVVKIEEGDGTVKLTLGDGRVVGGDVLVGADGVNSQVRRHLLPEMHAQLLKRLPFASIVGEPLIEGEVLEKLLGLGHSAHVVPGEGFHLFVGLKSLSEDGRSGRYYWFVNWHDEEAGTETFWTATATRQQLKDYALEKVSSLDPQFARIVEVTRPEELRLPPIVFKDMELEEIPEGRVTLLGDAAHPMVPFRGEGGLHAMQDALDLAEALSRSSCDGVEAVLKTYQRGMLSRGVQGVRNSREAFQLDENQTPFAWGKPMEMVDV